MIKLNVPSLKLFAKGQLEDIHNATLELLQRTGVVFKHPQALKVLGESGACVDNKTQRVTFPPYLVKEALGKAPSGVSIYARNPQKTMRFERGRVHFSPACTPIFAYDLDSGLRRPATLKDFEDITRLMDYLERVDEGFGAVYPQNIPEKTVHVHMMLAQAKNTSKCIRGLPQGATVARDCINMMSVVAGGEEELRRKPMLLCIVNSVSPLQWDMKNVGGALEYASMAQPVALTPEIMAGATGPVTLAGTMVQHNAEILSMLTLMQLMHPGTPVIYGAASTITDMRTSMLRLAAPELGLMHIGFAQLAEQYNLPTRGVAGVTDSKVLDVQAGYETAFNLLLAVLAGFNFVTYALGSMDLSLSVSYEKILTDHDLLGMVERLVRGVEVSDETIALDVISAVGPGGHYLAHKHTRDYHSKEHFIPQLLDTQPYDSWVKAGAKGLRDKAREEAKKILNEYHPAILDKDTEKQLEEYVAQVERRPS
jgi:trimethylamine--corrinoid protein Co-methyltransferase